MKARVHFIRMPKEGIAPWIGGVLLFLASIWFSGVAAVELGVDFISPFPIAIALTLLTASSLSFALGVQRRNNAVRAMSERIRRLERLLAHADAAARYPHRAVELLIRRRNLVIVSRKQLNELLTRCPPGTVILCTTASPFDLPLPQVRDIGFEPIPRDEDGCRRLLGLGYEDSIPELLLSRSQRAQHKDREGLAFGRRYAAVMFKIVINITFWVYVAALIFGSIFFIRRRDWGMFYFALTTLLVPATMLISFHLLEHKDWLVPGGILLAPRSRLRNRTRYQFRSRTTHRLFYGPYKAGKALHTVSSGKVDGHFDMPLRHVYAILTAWCSEARPPTDDEIRSFLEGRQ